MQAFEVFGDIVLRGADEAASAVEGVGDAASGMGDRLQSAGDNVQRLGDAVGSGGRTLTKFVTGPIAGAVGGAFAFASQLASTADEILDLSDATGMSAEAIQEWQHVADVAGVSSGAVTDAARRLSREVGGAGDMSDSTAESFDRLGISAEELSTMDADSRMDLVISRLSQVEDATERADMAVDIFGRRAEDLAPILGMTTAELEEAREAGQRYAMNDDQLAAADEFRQSMVELQAELSHVGRELMLELLPVLSDDLVPLIQDEIVPRVSDFAESVTDLIRAFLDLPEPMRQAVIKAGALAAAIGPGMMVLGPVIKVLGQFIGLLRFLPLIGGKFVLAAAAIAGIASLIFRNWEGITEFFGDMWEGMVDGIRDAVRGVRDWFGRMRGVIQDALGDARDAVAEGFQEMRDRAVDIVEGIRDAIGERWRAMVDGARERLQEMRNVVEDGANAVRQAFAAMRDAVVSRVRGMAETVLGRVREMAEGMVSRVRDAAQRVAGRMREMYDEVVGNSIIPDMTAGVVGEFRGMADDSAALAGDMTSDVTGRMRALESAPAMVAGGAGGGAAAAAGGGAVHVDMRNSVFRDDGDLQRRIQRRTGGAGLLGGLA